MRLLRLSVQLLHGTCHGFDGFLAWGFRVRVEVSMGPKCMGVLEELEIVRF